MNKSIIKQLALAGTLIGNSMQGDVCPKCSQTHGKQGNYQTWCGECCKICGTRNDVTDGYCKAHQSEHKAELTVDFEMIVGKYFNKPQDFINLMKANKKYREIAAMYKFNPISVDENTIEFFPNIQTLHLYKPADAAKLPGIIKKRKEMWDKKYNALKKYIQQMDAGKEVTELERQNDYMLCCFDKKELDDVEGKNDSHDLKYNVFFYQIIAWFNQYEEGYIDLLFFTQNKNPNNVIYKGRDLDLRRKTIDENSTLDVDTQNQRADITFEGEPKRLGGWLMLSKDKWICEQEFSVCIHIPESVDNLDLVIPAATLNPWIFVFKNRNQYEQLKDFILYQEGLVNSISEFIIKDGNTEIRLSPNDEMESHKQKQRKDILTSINVENIKIGYDKNIFFFPLNTAYVSNNSCLKISEEVKNFGFREHNTKYIKLGNCTIGNDIDAPELEILYYNSDHGFYLKKDAFKNCPKLKKIVFAKRAAYDHMPNNEYYGFDISGLRDGVEICFEDGSPSITYPSLITKREK